MAAAAAAANRVANTYELLEMIMLDLPIRTIIHNASLVCRSWEALINKSSKIQRALFFLPTSTTAVWQHDLTLYDPTKHSESPSYLFSFVDISRLTTPEKAFFRTRNIQAFKTLPKYARTGKSIYDSNYNDLTETVVPADVNPILYHNFDVFSVGRHSSAFPPNFIDPPFRDHPGSWENMLFCSVHPESIHVEGFYKRCGIGDCKPPEDNGCSACNPDRGEPEINFDGTTRLGDIVAPMEMETTRGQDLDWFWSRITVYGIEALEEELAWTKRQTVKRNTEAVKKVYAESLQLKDA